jgi:translation initiation factor IF-1
MANYKQKQNQGCDDVEVVKAIEFTGVVDKILPGTNFLVRLDGSNTTMLCTINGKLRQHKIRVLLADRVRCECSPYDMSRGRIISRL